MRPIANRVAPFELPTDSYFANIRDLFEKLEGVDEIMEDPQVTSVRLVTNPEKMVLRETQRAFVYFSLHGLTIDTVIVNRVLPTEVKDTWFNEWHNSQENVLRELEEYFAPVPVHKVPLFAHEVLGQQRLQDVAKVLYAEGEDPSAVTQTENRTRFVKRDGRYEVQLRLPFATKGEVGLFKKGDELVVEIGTLTAPRRPAPFHGHARACSGATGKSNFNGRDEGGTMNEQQPVKNDSIPCAGALPVPGNGGSVSGDA